MIGIDLVYVPRIARIVHEKPKFVERYFSLEECALFEKRGDNRVIAANFAAKEALLKALGCGLSGVNLRCISVLRDERGQPYFHLDDAFLTQFQKILEKGTPRVSLSHEHDYAVAMVQIL